MLRRVQLGLLALALVLAALSTGSPPLYFLVYLGLLGVGGAYLATRFGLTDLEAGYVLDRHNTEVGEALRVTYTVRNLSRLPKLWLEAYNPTTLPVPLPGRALALGPRGEQSWAARVRLTRRGHYRIDPLMLRTSDPIGLFESSASVGTPAGVIVHPRVEPIPGWKFPPAAVEGSHAHPVRTVQTTPHATSIRPYEPGDAYNRIHWRTSARLGELQVKEFDLEQTADVWLYLDLEASVHTGEGDESTLEYAVRAAAAICAKALLENRSLGITASGARTVVLPPDRGRRQYQRMLGLLAAVAADGRRPLVDVLVEGLPRLRRGMTAVVITPSLARDWVKPLGGLRSRGVTPVVVLPDPVAFDRLGRNGDVAAEEHEDEPMVRNWRSMRHALAEYDLAATSLIPRATMTEQLVTTGRSQLVRTA